MTGKQLKNSILQWAIQGKLVPQDPNDEPASVLLEKIRAEKAQLVKEGKLKKKDLEVKPIAEDEIPFEIPESWEWCRMQDVIEFVNGRAYKKDELLDKGKYKVLRVGNFFTNDSWYYSDLELPDEKYCYNGDLLYAWSASFGPQIWEGNKTIFHYHIWNVKYNQEVLYREYLYFFLLADKVSIKGSTTGSTMVHVSMENMKPRLIPLPPLAEQHRIVAKIEELMPLVDKYGAAQDALDEWNKALPEKLKKSILQEAYFGNHVGIQLSETKEVKLKDVCDIIMGQSPEGNTYNNSNGIEFHQGKVAFGNMFLKPSGVFTTSPTKYAEPDSIVVSVRAPVGTANITKRKICIGRGLACVMPKQNADLMYIYYFLESPEIREYLEDNATGTTFKAISGKVLQELELTLPPLAEQRRIVAKIEELIHEIDKLKA